MNPTTRYGILIMATAIFSVAMTSCFTGIESTPKITSDDVKKQNIPVREEDSFLSDIMPQPLELWKKGKLFYITDSKFALLLHPPLNSGNDIAGTIVSYEGCKQATDITGSAITDIEFLTESGKSVTFRLKKAHDRSASTTTADIPFLIECDIIEKLNQKLAGHTFYTVTSAWYDTNMQPVTGRKYVPARVDSVTPGNAYYSATLSLTDEKGNPFRLYMSVGDDLRSLRRFSSLFALKDPRATYPSITDATWNNIVNGKVAADMTKDECRMALGTPASIDRRVGYSSIQEVWSYENGVYLIFEDNQLRSFRQ